MEHGTNVCNSYINYMLWNEDFVLEPLMCKVGRYLDGNSGMMPLLSEVQTTLPLWLNLFNMVVRSYKCDSALCKTK